MLQCMNCLEIGDTVYAVSFSGLKCRGHVRHIERLSFAPDVVAFFEVLTDSGYVVICTPSFVEVCA